jgi:hypothetical protein
MSLSVSARTVVVSLLLLPVVGAAQATGVAGFVSVGSRSSLDQSTLQSAPTFGAGLVLPWGATRGLAFSFASSSPTLGVGAPTRPTLELMAELRQRVWGGHIPGQTEGYLFLGAGLSRASRDSMSHTGLAGQAGVAVAWPFLDAIGAEFRIGAGYERHPAAFLVAAVDSTTNRSGALSLRAGIALFLRPVAKARRLPVTAMPDVTEVPRPTASYQTLLFKKDTVAAAAYRAGDYAVGADPDARSGGTIESPYVARRIFTDSTLPKKNRKGADAKPDAKPESKADTVWTLHDHAAEIPHALTATADTARAPTAAPPATAAAPTAPRIAAPMPAVVPAPPTAPVVEAAPTDTIDTFNDANGTFLQIRPAFAAGHLTPGTMSRLVVFAESMVTEHQRTSYLVRVESMPGDLDGTERMLDDAYALRAKLVAAGVAPEQVVVRETPVSASIATLLRIVIRGPAAPSLTGSKP